MAGRPVALRSRGFGPARLWAIVTGMGGVEWGPAVVVLLTGLALGALLHWWTRRRGGPASPARDAPHPSLELRDLDGRIESRLQQLRELEDTAAKRTPAQLARERYALELEAARALQAREALVPRASPARGKGKGKGKSWPEEKGAARVVAKRPGRRRLLWGAAGVGAIALLLVLASRASEPRAKGGSVTGGPSPSARAMGPERTESQLRAAIERNPADFDARMELARELLRKNDLMGVWKETQYVLERSPRHPLALAYQGLVRLVMGQGDLAESMLKEARAAAPGVLEVHIHLIYVYLRRGKTKEAEEAIAEASRLFPAEAEALARLPAEMKRRGVGAEAPGGPERAAAEPPAEARGASVSGVIEADAAVRARIAPGAVLFVIVRNSGVAEGPPVAVKRLPASAFPLPFDVGPADSTMGQPFPPRFRIEARVDADGDPMTRDASEPKAGLDGVRAGARGLRLRLR